MENPISVRFYLFLLGSLFFICSWALPTVAQTQKGKVLREGAELYTQPNFDSQIVAFAKEGQIYSYASKKQGIFYLIRVGKKNLYIADSDFAPLKLIQQVEKKIEAQSEEPARAKSVANARRRLPFDLATWRGPLVSAVQFQESTMGKTRQETMFLVGGKFTGPDYFFEGAVVTDVNLLFSWKPPEYYATATGNSAQGWMMLLDYLFLKQWSHGPAVITAFGFGPLVRYSHFEVNLGSTTQTNYGLDDLNLGAKFQLGIGVRFSNLALRGDLQYFWEKSQYLGLGLSTQFQF